MPPTAMKLYVDVEQRKLVQGLSSNRNVSSPVFTQGDKEALEIHLLVPGDTTLYAEKALVVGDHLRVAIGKFSASGILLLSYTDQATILEGGGARVNLALDTEPIATALGSAASLSATLEIELSLADGTVQTVLQTACTLKNDLIESAASALGSQSVSRIRMLDTQTNTPWELCITDGAITINPIAQ